VRESTASLLNSGNEAKASACPRNQSYLCRHGPAGARLRSSYSWVHLRCFKHAPGDCYGAGITNLVSSFLRARRPGYIMLISSLLLPMFTLRIGMQSASCFTCTTKSEYDCRLNMCHAVQRSVTAQAFVGCTRVFARSRWPLEMRQLPDLDFELLSRSPPAFLHLEGVSACDNSL
jgi:hypothetical protein